MAQDFHVSTGDVAPGMDSGGGGGGGGGWFPYQGVIGGGGGGFRASFSVVQTGPRSYGVVRPLVVVVGVGAVPVTGGVGSSGHVWCNVTRTKQSGGDYAFTAKIEDDEDDDAYLSVHIADIPAAGVVEQYHVGAIVVGTPKVKSVDVVTSLEDASMSDSKLKMTYWKRSVDVMVSEESSSSSSSSSSVTIATLKTAEYVTAVTYDPSGHQLKYQKRKNVKFVVDDASASSSSASVFTAKPVCGSG